MPLPDLLPVPLQTASIPILARCPVCNIMCWGHTLAAHVCAHVCPGTPMSVPPPPPTEFELRVEHAIQCVADKRLFD